MKNSSGIDFFPFSVDFFDDDKIALIEAEFGIKGSYLAIRLLCKMYKFDGYYYQWGRDACLLLSKKLGADFSPTSVDEIVKGLLRRGFFCKSVFESFQCLTSRGMQYRYLESTRRRVEVRLRKELLLIDVSGYPNVHIVDDGKPVKTKTGEAAPLPAQERESPVASVQEPATEVTPKPAPRRSPSNVPSEEEERLEIIAYFTFDRNFINPTKQYELFRNWNNIGGRSWAKMNHSQRISAATMWKQQDGKGNIDPNRRFKPEDKFPGMWQKVYIKAKEMKAPADVLEGILEHKVRYVAKHTIKDTGEICNLIFCRRAVMDYMVLNKSVFSSIVGSIADGLVTKFLFTDPQTNNQ